jgi:hypothetical protein
VRVAVVRGARDLSDDRDMVIVSGHVNSTISCMAKCVYKKFWFPMVLLDQCGRENSKHFQHHSRGDLSQRRSVE